MPDADLAHQTQKGVSKLFPIIKELTELFGPVGREERVATYLYDAWRPHVRSVDITPVGNVVAHVGGKGPRLLITAHMDEICLYVKSITEEGFAMATHCHRGQGSYHLMDALSREFDVMSDDGSLVNAVLAGRTGHLRFRHSAQERTPDWKDVFLDFGASSKEELEDLGIGVGAPGVWKAQTRQLGHRIVGKAMDDRIGLALMTQLLCTLDKGLLQYDVFFAATVMEEFGLIGAASIPRHIPDLSLCVALEVGLAGDVPTVSLEEVPVRLGGGPMIATRDGMVHYTTKATETLYRAARQADITVQPIIAGYGTDAHEFIRQGVPSCLLAPPTRYTHTPIEMVDKKDVEDCLMILKTLVTSTS